MGVISVGASLGVAERAAARAPAVSPSSATANANQSASSVASYPLPPNASSTTSTSVLPVMTSHHHHVRRPHEYAYNSSGVHLHTQNGARSSKRGGRRKYAQQHANVAVFPPPPIITSAGALSNTSSVNSAATTPSPVVAGKPSSVRSNATSASGKYTATSAPSSPSHFVRAVTFETNVNTQLLAPFVLGAKGGSRLQAFMAQSKCSIVHLPASAVSSSEEVVIRLSSNIVAPSPSFSRSESCIERRMSFTVSGDTNKRVDHGVRLLQGAIETAEQILLRKKGGARTSSAAVVATNVPVDSGGNGKPSSGHVSASRAATPDHSIDNSPPPSRLPSSLLSSETLSSHGHDLGISRDSVDERKAQTRIRYHPTNQPQKCGPGFAPSRSIAESTTSVTLSTPISTVAHSSGKKRQLPVSSEGTGSCEPHKRERIISPTRSTVSTPHHQVETTSIENASVHPPAVNERASSDGAADPEFDEFRIRLTRGVEFARRIDAQAARVKQKMQREKEKYLQIVREAQMMKHQQRVADVVIRTQCAIMATSESSVRKRRRIEQLSAAQDVANMALQHRTKKISAHLPARDHIDGFWRYPPSASVELSQLMQKIAAFRAAASRGVDDQAEKVGEVHNKESSKSRSRSAEVFVESSDLPSSVETETKKGAAELMESHQYRTPDSDDRDKDSSIFRPRHLAPGVLRDMNLIQDYTDENDCALLHLLIGQRQYFYLETISLSFGVNDLERLEHEAVRTINDLEVIREFIMKRRRYASELLKSIEMVTSNGTQAFTTSKAPSWSSMQQSLLDMHPLLLALHLLALHYHAVAILEQKEVPLNMPQRDLLSGEDELSSDLFKYVLRPMRSSAIESSLNDALPTSLVRETIAHCPEVVNHVLDWKEESDVPPIFLHDVMATVSKKSKSNSAGSPMLRETLRHLQQHAGDFDRNFSELARHFQGMKSGGGVSGDKIVYLVNQLKALGARLLIANTQLQLHKWATVFVENSFSWFDDDAGDALDGNDGLCGDRSYDKFTCLQDALHVWHNAKLSYSAKDSDQTHDGKSVDAPLGDLDGTDSDHGREQDDQDQQDDPELVHLRRISPAEVLSVVDTKFLDTATVAGYLLTSQAIAHLRNDFNKSLAIMRASMKVLGRTAPWRTHVKHSNTLKEEYKRQRELENKLLLHQWAVYYKNRPLRCRQGDELPCREVEMEPGNEGDEDEDPSVTVVQDDSGNASISPDTDVDGGIILEPGDTPEVVDMKLLRHEIENVAKQMQTMVGTDAVGPDRKKLLDACNLLAASCVSALTRFLSHDESPPATESVRTGSGSARASRQRANSATKSSNEDPDGAPDDHGASRASSKSRQRSKSRIARDDDVVAPNVANHKDDESGSAKTGAKLDSPAPKRGKKGSSVSSARRPRAHSTSSASPRTPPTATSAQNIPPVSSRSNASKVSGTQAGTVGPILAEPLRMGCSGCRDTRRRCTGCHGCCLHCVCVGCGCRMCCSSRTASVQKTLSLLVSAVETRMGCKWIELDAIGDHSERCGMVKSCSVCQQCASHCKCHPSTQASYCHTGGTSNGPTTTATAGFPSSTARKERRFRINPTAAHRRQNHVTGGSDDEAIGSSDKRPSSAGGSATKRTRRSNSDATPSMLKDDPVDSTTGSDFMSSEFSGSSTDGIPFVSSNPPAQHKDEQEDLFRAARVRMKLQRNTLPKANHPYGLIPPNTLIEGEMLWHPDRIRLMWERKDVYGVLGVPREASSQLIKKQYRKLVLKLHPDKVQGTSEAGDATLPHQGEPWTMDDRVSAFVAVTQAYKLLSGEIGAIHNNGWKTPTS